MKFKAGREKKEPVEEGNEIREIKRELNWRK
jgi:hypothetical protein